MNKAQVASLSEIYKRHKKVTTELVKKAAADENHPLHKLFTWNDTEAGEKCRTEEARKIIMAWKTIVLCERARGEKPTRVKVRQLLPSFRQTAVYTIRSKVLEVEDTRLAFVRQRLCVLRDWCNSVSDVSELKELRLTIQDGLKEFDD